jgi:YHS domain-containing protein
VFRLIFYLLVTVFLITIVRGVLGVILRGLSQLVSSGQTAQAKQSPGGSVPLSGELKKDPSCGTYISAATAIKQTVGGQTYHFCSAECRDKYVASLAR